MSSHPCAGCGRFAFPKRGTVCYWCQGGQQWTAAVPHGTSGSLTTDDLREQLERDAEAKRKGRR